MSENQTTSRPQGEDERPSAYPTYRDGPVPPHEATATKPTDVGLPQSRRTYPWPAILAVAVAAVAGMAPGALGKRRGGAARGPAACARRAVGNRKRHGRTGGGSRLRRRRDLQDGGRVDRYSRARK